MTVEERKQLCEALRGKRSWSGALAKLMPDAADEIERLAKELAEAKEMAQIYKSIAVTWSKLK